MKIRIGMEGGRIPCLERARVLNAPLLVSANSLWDNERKKFYGWRPYLSFDTALDSGGFVAMFRYGGYRWTPAQYAELAANMAPTWWAQMDFCCEPQIASNRHQVFKRIDMTVEYLHKCQHAARCRSINSPMPVLQGWHPEDYCAGPIYDQSFDWPEIVGVGSVCRRHTWGSDGVIAVVDAIDRAIPPHVKLHLFGVKSSALAKLVERFPSRIASTDSMAWSMSARVRAREECRPCNGLLRADELERWYKQQQHLIS